jgi:hypothetical protein
MAVFSTLWGSQALHLLAVDLAGMLLCGVLPFSPEARLRADLMPIRPAVGLPSADGMLQPLRCLRMGWRKADPSGVGPRRCKIVH